MLNVPSEMVTRIQPSVKTMQVITMALVMVPILFAAVILAAINTDSLHSEPKMLIFLAAATGVVSYLLSFFFGPAFRKTVNASDPVEYSDVKTLLAGLQTSHVIQCAMIEAGIYLNLVVLLLDHGWVNLYMAGLGMVLLMLLFPSKGRTVRKIEKGLND